jgi:hypothetical protein
VTTRHGGYVVVLENDIREDDAEAVINALKMTKGVVSVQPIEGGGTIGEIVVTSRVNIAWQERLIALIKEMQSV